MADVTVTNNPEESRYEARLDGELAGYVEYTVTESVITFPHTKVFSQCEGKGVGGALARGALDDVRATTDRTVRPQCPFIKGWSDKHPDDAVLLS